MTTFPPSHESIRYLTKTPSNSILNSHQAHQQRQSTMANSPELMLTTTYVRKEFKDKREYRAQPHAAGVWGQVTRLPRPHKLELAVQNRTASVITINIDDKFYEFMAELGSRTQGTTREFRGLRWVVREEPDDPAGDE